MRVHRIRFMPFALVALNCATEPHPANTAGSGGALTSAGTANGGSSESVAGNQARSGAGGNANGGVGGTTGSAGQGTGNVITDVTPNGMTYAWVGVIGTGQSLSVGYDSTSLSTHQPFHNLMLQDQGPDPKYPIDGSASAQWSVAPLIEPARTAVTGSGIGYGRAINQEYPNNLWQPMDVYGETPHSAMANTLSAIWAARGSGEYVSAHSVVGVGGACLNAIGKGSRSFLAALSETRVFKRLADANAKTYGVGVVIFTHGECDALIGNAQYGDQVFALQQDYDAAIKAITGQKTNVILLGSQESSIAAGYESTAVQLWRAGNAHPDQVICTGPKYAFAPYGVHLPGSGYASIGEKYAEVFDIVFNQGKHWKPLGPTTVKRSGAVITADFEVPNPPLAWADNLSAPHQTMHTAWAAGKGFEVIDAAKNEIAIASVAIDDHRVVITLAAAPAAGTQLTLGYAVTPDADGYLGGWDSGLHGQLRDSDSFAGYTAETIEVQVTSGSKMVTAAPGSLARRAVFDLVSGPGVPANTVVSALNKDALTLSAAWSGATGPATLSFHHDHYNYAVHFSIPVSN